MNRTEVEGEQLQTEEIGKRTKKTSHDWERMEKRQDTEACTLLHVHMLGLTNSTLWGTLNPSKTGAEVLNSFKQNNKLRPKGDSQERDMVSQWQKCELNSKVLETKAHCSNPCPHCHTQFYMVVPTSEQPKGCASMTFFSPYWSAWHNVDPR